MSNLCFCNPDKSQKHTFNINTCSSFRACCLNNKFFLFNVACKRNHHLWKTLIFTGNKKTLTCRNHAPKGITSARSRSLSYTVWFDSILLLCLDTQCTISSCIATGFFPVKRLPEADRILQKIIPCIHRIKPFPRIRVLPQNRIYGFALWQIYLTRSSQR